MKMTDVYTPLIDRSSPTPGCRAVVSAYIPAVQGDYLVPIPFRGRLVHCQTSVIVATGATHDHAVALEKDVAGGTVLASGTVANSSGVGTEDTLTLTAGLTSDDFTVDNQDICVADTGTTNTGSFMLYMIFESAVGQ